MITLFFFLILLLFLCWFINSDGTQNKERYIYIFFVFFLTLISGMRYEVGADFKNYEIMYNKPDSVLNNFVEPSWHIISRFFHFLNLKSVYWFMFTSFVINMNILRTVWRYSKSFILSMFIYVSSGQLFFQSMNIVRQYFAISIIFGFINLYIDRKYFKFIIVILIASLFHKSALITIPLFFLAKIKIHPFFLSLILIVSYIIKNKILFLIKFLLGFIPKYSAYLLHLVPAKTTSGLYVTMLLLIGLSMIWIFRNLKKNYEWLNMTIMSFVIYMVLIDFEAGQRMNLYFLPSIMILVSYIPNRKKIEKSTIQYFSIIFGFLLFQLKAVSSLSYNIR